jgi:2-dehydro-3-deoxyphosphogluconate aldolase/(4S)-4-hydroxy-2-oxoglutarate aldolase
MLKALEPVITKIHTYRRNRAFNLAAYLGCKDVLACGGSWMVKSDLIEKDNFSEIEGLHRSCDLVKKIRSSA